MRSEHGDTSLYRRIGSKTGKYLRPGLIQMEQLATQAGLCRLRNYLKSLNQPNAVFIWIPKNAGTTVYNVLANHGCQKMKLLPLIKYKFPNRGFVTFSHMDYAKLLFESYVSTKYYQKAFKFCMTRDPYRRAVSLFAYEKKVGRLGADESFHSFCQLLRKKSIPDIGLYHYKGLSECNPQTRWLRDLEVDFTGRVEDLTADLNRVLTTLDFETIERAPRLNTTKRMSHQRYYCAETKAIVEDYYAQDFEQLGYPVQNW